MASPDLLVEGLEPGAAYIAAVTSINKKVRGLTVGFSTKSLDWPGPDLMVEGLEPGATYIAAVTSINKKVSSHKYTKFQYCTVKLTPS